jgi:UDP-glucose 4-epimerase
MKIIITGVAGFVGSNLLDALIEKNYEILGIDNLSTGKFQHIEKFTDKKNFSFLNLDLSEKFNTDLFKGFDAVIHLAALADIRYNINNFEECLNKNIISTNNVIEAVVENKIKKILFASTCSVYGNVNIYPTQENETLEQTSVYSATKIASEKILEGFANTFEFHAYTMRFVSMIGPKYSHGHIYDFVQKMQRKDAQIDIIGNGESLKSYLHIYDAVDAILKLLEYNSENYFEAFNVGHPSAIKLKYSLNKIIKIMDYKGRINFGEGNSGWIGDNPIIIPDINKLRKIGWNPQYSAEKGIEDTVDWLIKNPWIHLQH